MDPVKILGRLTAAVQFLVVILVIANFINIAIKWSII